MSSKNDDLFYPARIKEIRTFYGLNTTDFAKELDLTQSYISQLERGNKAPSLELLAKFKNKMNINMEWFFTGRPPMRINYDKNPTASPISVNIDGEDFAIPLLPKEHLLFLRELFSTETDNDATALAMFHILKMKFQSWGWIKIEKP